jgi:hypothetical protein
MKLNAYIPSVMIAIVLSACGTMDPSNQSSTFNTSQPIGRLGVAEMVNTLDEGNYSLTIFINEEEAILYQYDLPYIYLDLSEVLSGVSASFYIDYTNEQAPILYFQNEAGTWTGMPSNPSSLEMLNFSTLFFDPTILQSEWFVWDEEVNAYILDSNHFLSVFGSEEAFEGIEDVRVTLDGQGGFTFSMMGFDPENPSVNQSFALVYEHVGTTVVTLPEGIEDPITVFLNDVLANSTNHNFFLNYYEVTDDLENPLFLTGALWGSRDGTDFSTTLSDYDSEGVFSIVMTTYYTQTNEGYFTYIETRLEVVKNQITQATYGEALAGFYPFNVFAIEEDWIDKNLVKYAGDESIAMYGIRSNYIATLVGETLPAGATSIQAYVAFITFEGTSSLSLSIEYLFQGKAYQMDFFMTSFGYADVYVPQA